MLYIIVYIMYYITHSGTPATQKCNTFVTQKCDTFVKCGPRLTKLIYSGAPAIQKCDTFIKF